MAVLPNSILCGESDFTMTKLRVSVLERGCSPIVISNGTSPMDQECFPENPTKGITSHVLLLSMYTRPTFLPNTAALMITGVLLTLVTGGNVLLLAQYFCLSCLPLRRYQLTLPSLSLCLSPNAKVALNLWLLGSGL
ncbi:hypothetical protein Tco_0037253 [Tanacetum coccineum]